MIDSKKINDKFQSLNDKINDIASRFGEETASELMIRIESSLESFLIDFKEISSKSFKGYWEKQEYIKFKNDESVIDSKPEDKNIPKFISDYDKKNNKK